MGGRTLARSLCLWYWWFLGNSSNSNSTSVGGGGGGGGGVPTKFVVFPIETSNMNGSNAHTQAQPAVKSQAGLITLFGPSPNAPRGRNEYEQYEGKPRS
ncbi:hypothetical protein M0802_004321 [Mischocyttarus mexicanus]|nr:hypothetical protein M0802_004321 [Mischocyttarus mexicanus]